MIARDRLRLFQRGTLGQNNASITELADPIVPGRHGWLTANWLDSRGNWLTHVTRLNAVTYRESRTVNGVNEYTAIDPDDTQSPPDPVSLTHDNNGNVTSDPTAPNVGGYAPGQMYGYDEENRLTWVLYSNDPHSLLDIRYDAIGRRVESVEYVDPANGAQYAVPQVTRHIHAGLTVIEEYNVTTNGVGGYLNERQRDFVWGDQYPEPVAMIDRTSAGAVGAGTDEVFHYLRDDLGSVVGLTNADGVLVERYVYDPYGQTYIEKPDGQGGWTLTDGLGLPFEASSLGNPWMWTGQRYDAGVKLYHFLFRGYSPHLGRWLQRDPIGYIDGPNLYQYVMSNPLFWTDPLGRNVVLPPGLPPLPLPPLVPPAPPNSGIGGPGTGLPGTGGGFGSIDIPPSAEVRPGIPDPAGHRIPKFETQESPKAKPGRALPKPGPRIPEPPGQQGAGPGEGPDGPGGGKSIWDRIPRLPPLRRLPIPLPPMMLDPELWGPPTKPKPGCKPIMA